jgi:hypothetical protein
VKNKLSNANSFFAKLCRVNQFLRKPVAVLCRGDTRVNFVGHGNDLSQEGAQSLADKVKILQQTL